MELPPRAPGDELLKPGELRRLRDRVRRVSSHHDLTSVIAYAFDPRTRMLPFVYADLRMAPAGVRAIGSAMVDVGFRKSRVVLQQWKRNFRPSRMRLDGRIPDVCALRSAGARDTGAPHRQTASRSVPWMARPPATDLSTRRSRNSFDLDRITPARPSEPWRSAGCDVGPNPVIDRPPPATNPPNRSRSPSIFSTGHNRRARPGNPGGSHREGGRGGFRRARRARPERNAKRIGVFDLANRDAGYPFPRQSTRIA